MPWHRNLNFVRSHEQFAIFSVLPLPDFAKKVLLSFDDFVAKLFASVIRWLVVSHELVCCLS